MTPLRTRSQMSKFHGRPQLFLGKLFFIIMPIILSTTLSSSLAISGTPHLIYGRVFNSDGSFPNKDHLEANAYIPVRPDEILGESSVGCGYDLFSDGGWLWFEAGNYPTPWSINENFRIIVIDTQRGETGVIDLVLDGSGSQLTSDLTLQPGDRVGPIAYNAKVDGSNPAFIPEGRASFSLTADLDDSLSGNNNIQSAEYFIDTDPGFGSATPMVPKDGSFNSPHEKVEATVDTSFWRRGSTHIIYVRGKDTVGNWGAAHRVLVSVMIPGDCNDDGKTTIDEVQKCINQYLGISPVQPCNDLNGDGRVTTDELERVINAYLGL